MNLSELNCPHHGLASLHALGVLSEEERTLFDEHLRNGCSSCARELAAHARIVGEMALLPPPAVPPRELRARLLDTVGAGLENSPASAIQGEEPPDSLQVWKTWSPTEKAPNWLLVRRNEGEWVATSRPGVAVRRLFVDPEHDQVTMLVRMAPGSSYPPHRHAGPEECYVISGDLRVGELVMKAGDYQRVAGGSTHTVQSTDDGCVLFIVSSLADEILT